MSAATAIAAAESPQPEAERDQREAAEHGERGEDVGGEMERIRFQSRALRLPPDAAQLARPPGIDDDLDEQNADRDEAEQRRRAAGR